MAQIKSQIKRNRTNEIARLKNAKVLSSVRTAIKKVKIAVEKKDKDAANAALKAAVKAIDKGYSLGAYHKNTAARKKSEVCKLVNSLK